MKESKNKNPTRREKKRNPNPHTTV